MIISTTKKLKFFRTLQNHLSITSFLIYFDKTKQLYINLNSRQKKSINVMIYYINVASFEKYSSKVFIEFILFLSKLLNSVETRYWSIELKLTELIWILRKVCHSVKSSQFQIIIYTDHDAFLKIVEQINFSIFSIDKFNLRLIRVRIHLTLFSDYKT